MRDLLVTAIVFGGLPFVFKRPWLGILGWTWIGLMNPHRLGWGFATEMNFAYYIAIVTLVAILFGKEKKSFPMTPMTGVHLLFILWIFVTVVPALYQQDAWDQMEKIAKIQLFIMLTIVVMQSRERIRLLVWVSTLSLAFFGVKGGIFTLRSGGVQQVLGPPDSFIAGNTEIGLALTMTIPLLWYLQHDAKKRWLKLSLWVAMALCAASVIGSYSRGDALAIAAMSVFLLLKSRQKLKMAVFLVVLTPAILMFMPDRWFEKIGTIQNYQTDGSAMGRINAWSFAWNLAKDRPIVGGGPGVFTPEAFATWAPDPSNFHASHSIWFEVLAAHGFVGLGLFILMWLLAWRTGSSIIKLCRKRPELDWARQLAAAIQVSLVGFWVGGSFLGLCYWDFPYILIAVLVLTRLVVERELASARKAQTHSQQVSVAANSMPDPVYRGGAAQDG